MSYFRATLMIMAPLVIIGGFGIAASLAGFGNELIGVGGEVFIICLGLLMLWSSLIQDKEAKIAQTIQNKDAETDRAITELIGDAEE